MTAITSNDTPVAVEGEGVELRLGEIGGDMSVAFIRLREGMDMTPALRGLPGDMCQARHWGYVFKGRVKIHTEHGAEIYEAGQAFYWPPGHVPEALEDCEFMDFSPTAEFDKVIEHIRSQAA
ncbi:MULTISPECIES: hypothetical protein [unclassified Streptomyces]|uniref:hypothetical protein n=1 Tax=unclassified Streptomyces TaxID=2593676 RepID=UPI002DD7B228|nr:MULTISPECIES: hypothetical protein [unclassified Streptomyces]WSA92883.1 hypothetical protein OIE63_15885 [Streptomyces sp. NBC_01795]WSB77252.1 hypothetical protein OHB04_16720 [Streptomyces sp. NBC_01775]WSS14483.1 hypothetical protein OG533_23250 [Streptomyces sp. NBC_01186]WSS43300.1 hypothetical protein OG220_23930 [Streptomyces sp. NBC_01187]